MARDDLQPQNSNPPFRTPALYSDAYEVLRLRARRAGQSIQLYMRDQLIALAGRPTKEESLVAIESVLARTAGGEPTAACVVDDLIAERR